MNNKINISVSNSSGISYSNGSTNRITMINKQASKGNGMDTLVDVFTDILPENSISESIDDKVYNEVTKILEGTNLPKVYQLAAVESICEVLAKEHFVSATGAKNDLINNFDKVAQKMKDKGYNISPLLNEMINIYAPEMESNLSEEYANELIDYLYKKNPNATYNTNSMFGKIYKRPIDEMLDIMDEKNELNKYGRLLNFLKRSNEKIDFNYDTVKKQIPGVTKIYMEELPRELENYGIVNNDYKATEEDYKKLWDSVLNGRKKSSYDAITSLYPDLMDQIECYVNEQGYSIKGLDKEKALKNISGNFASFLRKLSKVNNSTGIDSVENTKILLEFLGASKGEMVEIAFNNIGPVFFDSEPKSNANNTFHSHSGGGHGDGTYR